MTPEHDESLNREHAAFADWDGAYVLGALAPDERRAYEDHLAGCTRCRTAVTELAPLPGLLARARPRMAPPTDDTPTPDETPTADDEPGTGGGPRSDLVDVVVRLERRRRTRRRLIAGLAAVLVLGLAIAAPAVVQRLTTRTTTPAQTVALTRHIDTPLTATVAFTPTPWGTRLSMECDYPATSASSVYGQPGSADGGIYSLVVTDLAGRSTQVSTWSAQPGLDVHLDAATAVPLERIASVAVQSAAGTTVLAARVATG